MNEIKFFFIFIIYIQYINNNDIKKFNSSFISDNETNTENEEKKISAKNCKNCYKNNICIKCNNNYGLLGSKKNNKLISLSLDELSNGVYKENNIYYPCMANCNICNNDSQCLSCKKGFIFINNDYSKCVQISSINLKDYYTNDNINFYFHKYEKNKKRKEFKNDYTPNPKRYLQETSDLSSDFSTDIPFTSVISNMQTSSTVKISDTTETSTNIISTEIFPSTISSDSSRIFPDANKTDYYESTEIDDSSINSINSNTIISSFIESDTFIKEPTYSSSVLKSDSSSEIIENSSSQINTETNEKETNSNEISTSFYDSSEDIGNTHSDKLISDSTEPSLISDTYNTRTEILNNSSEITTSNQILTEILYSTNQYIFTNDFQTETPYSSSEINISNEFQTESPYSSIIVNTTIEFLTEIPESSSEIITNGFPTEIPDSSSDINITNGFPTEIPDSSSDINITNGFPTEITQSFYEIPPEPTTEQTVIPTTIPNPIITTIIYPNPYFELCILQSRIINKHLKLFVTIPIQIYKLPYINITISLYKNLNAFRFLQENKLYYKDHPVTLYRNESESLEAGKIFELTSKELFPNEDTIVIDLKSSSEYEMKLLNNNNNILNTKENEKMISNGETIDFSTNENFTSLTTYTIASLSSIDCDFKLTSRSEIKEENQNINLTFTQRDNTNNKIRAQSTLSSANNQISGKFEEKINNYYYLDSYIGVSEQGIFYITPEDSENYFNINCEIEKGGPNFSKILIIVGAVLLGVIIIIVVIVCIKKRKSSYEYNPKEIKREMKFKGDSSFIGLKNI